MIRSQGMKIYEFSKLKQELIMDIELYKNYLKLIVEKSNTRIFNKNILNIENILNTIFQLKEYSGGVFDRQIDEILSNLLVELEQKKDTVEIDIFLDIIVSNLLNLDSHLIYDWNKRMLVK